VVDGRDQHPGASSSACWSPSTGSTATYARRSESASWAGFTTFSTFSVQIVLEVDSGEPGRAAGYFLATVIGGVAAATAGYVLGRKLA
jgi:hypothetical protein